MGITILGLGPGAGDLLTQQALQRLHAADHVYVRTVHHPSVADLPGHLTVHSFDYLYEQEPTFAAVYAAITQQVLELGSRPQGVLYAVPGHPLVAEATVAALLHRGKAEDVPVEIVAGLSFIEPALAALQIDPFSSTGLQLVDALQPRIDPARPALIAQIYSQQVAAQLKLDLLELYPPEHPVTLVMAAGGSEPEQVYHLPLYELDRNQPINHLTCLYLPALTLEENLATFDGLAAIVARLRAPDGCPWDREQTHTSLKPYLLEEAYEAQAALDEEDLDKLQEELGDLMLNILLQCQIAAEAGEFEARDMVRGIASKLIRRHPHVFGDFKAATPEQVVQNWEVLKGKERAAERSMLDGLPTSLPSLAYARSLQERIAPLHLPVTTALTAEATAHVGWLSGQTKAERRTALGEALLELSFLAAGHGLDPEEALRFANARLARQIRSVEDIARLEGSSIQELDAARRALLWSRTASTQINPP